MRAQSWTTLGLVAALAAGAGCQKDRLTDPDTELDVADPNASRPVRGDRASSLPLDRWPANTEALVGIDVAQFRKSPLGRLSDNALRALVAAPAACGTRIVESADRVLIVSTSGDPGTPIYVFDGVARKTAEGCTTAPSVWLDDDTLAVAPGWSEDALRSATNGNDQRTNPRVLENVSHVDTGAALWFAGFSLNATRSPTQMRGVIALDSGLRASFEIEYADADAAAQAAKSFESSVKAMPPFSQYLEDARASTDGAWLRANIVMSSNQLKRMADDPIFSGIFPDPDPEPRTQAVIVD